MIMDTMNSLKIKNMMYVAAFMAVTGIAQAGEEAAGSGTPSSVKEKKSLFERAQGRVSSLADRARQRINGSEQKANEKIAQNEEKTTENIEKATRTLGTIKNMATGTAACVRKEVYTAQLTVLQTQAQKAQEMSSFFAEQKEQLDTQIKNTLHKIAAADKVCVATGENAEPAEKKEGS